MYYMILTLTLMLLTFAPAMGQGGFVLHSLKKISDDERAFLRKGFNLPDSASITEIKSTAFGANASSSLKVNLESIIDPKVRETVTNWVSEWNQKEADKLGKIEIVPGSQQADVTLVRYLRALPATDPISGLTWTDPKGKVHGLVPVYSYLMVLKLDGLDILWRKVDLTYREEHEASAKLLANELKKLMKQRAKSQKSK